MNPDALLSFWFERPDAWYRKDPAFDEELRARFGELHAECVRGDCADWEVNAEGSLALVLVLDQLSRNLYRDDPRAFAADAQARGVAGRAIDRGYDRQLAPSRREFLYMPFMHSEVFADQMRCCALFLGLSAELPSEKGTLTYAEQHRKIIERFGRFPHR